LSNISNNNNTEDSEPEPLDRQAEANDAASLKRRLSYLLDIEKDNDEGIDSFILSNISNNNNNKEDSEPKTFRSRSRSYRRRI
jgi:hypothetical protein